MILGEMCVLKFIYIYVAACRFCVVRFLTIIGFYLLFSIYSTYVFIIFFVCLFSCFVYLFSILCILCFCIVLYIVSPFVYSCLFPIFVQVYRPLPSGGNPIAVNKYRIISYLRNSNLIRESEITIKILILIFLIHANSYCLL